MNFITIATSEQFYDVLKNAGNKLVAIDFTATWCGPCRFIGPKFEELSLSYPDAVFVKVDVDQFPDIAAAHGVTAMPTFWFYVNGVQRDKMVGSDVNKLRDCTARFYKEATEVAAEEDYMFCQSLPCFQDLLTNPRQLFMDASELLVKFATNVSNNPKDPKYRSIRIGNSIFQSRLLPVSGSVECLFMMGFEEMEDRLVFPEDASLEILHKLRNGLMRERAAPNTSTKEGIASLTASACATSSQLKYQPMFKQSSERSFYNRVISTYEAAALYEDKDIQEAALSVIPHASLLQKAKERYSKVASHEGITISERDCLLLCLLEWFKFEFFKWMDAPKCPSCCLAMTFSGHVAPTPDDQRWGASTVENYTCTGCSAKKRMPRYNHPKRLLESRCGRCGEWANCFTLCCRALDFEARYVSDWTDHVWTEVYSNSQKRWMHCDPCENKCDTPLIYESGWGKPLSYIIAASKDQIVDVTWRYSTKHKDVCRRRHLVTEKWLSSLLAGFNKEIRQSITKERQGELDFRFAIELVEFISSRSASDKEKSGRESGSLAWRTLRGETRPDDANENSKKVFKPSEAEIVKREMTLKYCASSDCYSCDDEAVDEIRGWENGAWQHKSVFRKVESDWKMVYLARTEGSDSGSVTWCFDVSKSGLAINTVEVTMTTATYEGACVDVVLRGDEDSASTVTMESDHLPETESFSGHMRLLVTATLNGGRGDVAWQHAQLFRQSLDANSNSMEIKITLDKK